MKRFIQSTMLGLVLASLAFAQEETTTETVPTFEGIAAGLQKQVDAAFAELNSLRDVIDVERAALSEELSKLEDQLVELRATKRERDLENAKVAGDVAKLSKSKDAREAEATRIGDMLNSYLTRFEGQLHRCEQSRYFDAIDEARNAGENANLSEFDAFLAQAAMIELSLDRIEAAPGGEHFLGSGVNEERLVKSGEYVLFGPQAIFRSHDGDTLGLATAELNSVEAAIVPFKRPEDVARADDLMRNGRGEFPFDITMGNAAKVEETNETFWEHAMKGGAIMYPILGMAALALLVALYKWLRLTFVKKPSKKSVGVILTAVREDDRTLAEAKAKKIGGPVGRMLSAGIENLDEPKELIEEILYEKVLTSKVKLNTLLPFIAICAAASPLLGLLGTVQGIIETFKQINIHGSGDVKMLSAGISKALITTEFGLIVAIPSLLLHAFLARKARGVVNAMETTAISFVNEVMKARSHELTPEKSAPRVRDEIRSVLSELITGVSGSFSEEDQAKLVNEVEKALNKPSSDAVGSGA